MPKEWTNNEHLLIEWCLKYQDNLMAIKQANVFNSKGVKIILNFTPDGTLNNIIEGQKTLWRRQKVIPC